MSRRSSRIAAQQKDQAFGRLEAEGNGRWATNLRQLPIVNFTLPVMDRTM